MTTNDHIHILIDADARIAQISVWIRDIVDGCWDDAEHTYASEDWHGADWLAKARADADALARRFGLIDIVESTV